VHVESAGDAFVTSVTSLRDVIVAKVEYALIVAKDRTHGTSAFNVKLTTISRSCNSYQMP
jgi:hypothetical protein